MVLEEQNTSPVLGKKGLPMRLFMQCGFPVTDMEGNVLRGLSGEPLAVLNETVGAYKDTQGRDLTDAMNMTYNHPHFDPTQLPISNGGTVERQCFAVLYDFKGRPLTDSMCRPLVDRDGHLLLIFGPLGEPISDARGEPILDQSGCVIQSNSLHLSIAGRPLRVFDFFGQPLTDSMGNVLLDLCGVMLIVVDDSKVPVRTITDCLIYDALQRDSFNPNFNLTHVPPHLNVINTVTVDGEPSLAFNQSGQPLTDFHGVPLSSSTGTPMIALKNHIWLDAFEKEPILIRKSYFDNFSMKRLKNLQGDPLFLFNNKGWPLTDLNGTPQNHATGSVLISFNSNMEPVSDWLGNDLYDSFGCPLSDPNFQPCRKIDRLKALKLMKVVENFQCFNEWGFPLTNRFGLPLLNSQQQSMVIFDSFGRPLNDIKGDPVFDISGLPVCIDLNAKLVGPNGCPVRLYNDKGKPITDRNGQALKSICGKHYLTVTSGGRLNSVAENFFDKNSNSNHCQLFNATVSSEEKNDRLVKTDGSPLQLFDQSGYPLTDSDGFIMYDNADRPLVKCGLVGVITTFDGHKAFDVNGFPCSRNISRTDDNSRKRLAIFDKFGRPVTDQSGKILKNRNGHKLVRKKYGALVNTLYGGGLYDMNHISLNDPEAEPRILLPRESHQVSKGVQLFDCDSLPLTDSDGYVLYSSTGVALVKLSELTGKPVADFIGRPVFDDRGLPVTQSSGRWLDSKGRPLRLFNRLGFPLTDFEGQPLKNISGDVLVKIDDIGRPSYTLEYRLVLDSKGRTIFNSSFKPICKVSTPQRLIEMKTKAPLQVYNAQGWPLTSEEGYVLVNAKGKPLVVTKNGMENLVDRKGCKVFDALHRPLGCHPERPMICPGGEPYLLYDITGCPMTTNNGIPLCRNNKCLILFDNYGRPCGYPDEVKVFDAIGRELPVWN